MRTPINIDLNKSQRTINAGRVEEINAQQLVITVPDNMLDSAFFIVQFKKLSGTVPSTQFTASPITISLWGQLTAESPISFWVEGYDSDGTYRIKSRAVTLVYSGPAGGDALDLDDDPQAMAVDVAKNTAARHTHANKALLDGYDGTGGGIPTYSTTDNLPEDANEGDRALVGYVDRTGRLTIEWFDYFGADVFRSPLINKLYVSRTIGPDNISTDNVMVLARYYSGFFSTTEALGGYMITKTLAYEGASEYILIILEASDNDVEDYIPKYLYAFDDIENGGQILNANIWYKSEDGGVSWTRIISPDLTGICVFTTPQNEMTPEDMMFGLSTFVSDKPWYDVEFIRRDGLWNERG